jgi:signal peptidase I
MWGRGRQSVQRDLLIGKAFFIYWPHSLDEYVPFTPNVPRMGFVR